MEEDDNDIDDLGDDENETEFSESEEDMDD